ncbi:MAG: hypothetical protein RSC68_27725 [Acinetobacter sp.]
MEKIRTGEQDALYEIKSIRSISINVLQIVFSGLVPENWGDITIYTSGGQEADTLTGYSTVYRDEGLTVYLSNDGSVYQPPEDPGEILPTKPYVPTLQELQASKKAEISADCQRTIYTGVNVQLPTGVEHFSLTEHDQLNLFGKQAQIAAGATQLEYHADGQPCRYFTPADMAKIVQEAMWHVSYHTTYCNALNMWIASAVASSDLQAITYGADVPVAYQSDVLKAYLKDLTGVANAPG